MYGFVTHTWNAIKGKCPFDCSYCYMKKWGNLKAPRLDESEFKTDLGSGNFIFVGSSIDMWHPDISKLGMLTIWEHLKKYPKNKYLFQSKDPWQFESWMHTWPDYFEGIDAVFATTIETNRNYYDISNAPPPSERADTIKGFKEDWGYPIMITVEPVLDFDLDEFVALLKSTNADQINIGAVTGGYKLPEPSKEKLQALIGAIMPHLKSNIKRLM